VIESEEANERIATALQRYGLGQYNYSGNTKKRVFRFNTGRKFTFNETVFPEESGSEQTKNHPFLTIGKNYASTELLKRVQKVLFHHFKISIRRKLDEGNTELVRLDVKGICGDNRGTNWFLALCTTTYGEKPTVEDVTKGKRPVDSAAFAFADIVVRERVDPAHAIELRRKAIFELQQKKQGCGPMKKGSKHT